MKIKNKDLTVHFNTLDISSYVSEYGVEYPMSLQTTDSLYVGYDKPIQQIFIELKTPNTVNGTLIVQKFNGTLWQTINILDKTNGLKKSEFIYFDEDNLATKTTVNTIEKYWLKFTITANTSAIVLNGLNMVFNSLYDMKKIVPAIEQFYPRDIKSHILSIAAARDIVIERINNAQPYKTYTGECGCSVDIRLLNQFDVFSTQSLRRYSALVSIEYMYLNMSDAVNDKKFENAEVYRVMAEEAWNSFAIKNLSLDINQDGTEKEKREVQSIYTIKAVR